MTQPAAQWTEAAACAQVPRPDTFSSYPPENVTFLVKDLSSALVEASGAECEDRIDQGRHYGEMLPEEEYRPTSEALTLFEHALHLGTSPRPHRGYHHRASAVG